MIILSVIGLTANVDDLRNGVSTCLVRNKLK
jgi:hypothetical protein